MEKERDSFSVTGMLADLDGGTFESKLDYALRTTARDWIAAMNVAGAYA
jgi:hypothetical protein